MKDELWKLLKSRRPSDRSRAIEGLRSLVDDGDSVRLRRAVQDESVPGLRRQLEALLRSTRETRVATQAAAQGKVAPDPSAAEEEFVGWMRHELEPAIGWLRFAASDDIELFEKSVTRSAIEDLRARLDSVEALVRASAPLRYERVSLGELIAEVIGGSGPAHERVAMDLAHSDDDFISTDPRMFKTLLRNALQNGLEASAELTVNARPVRVAAEVRRSDFWINVTNGFAGEDFSMDEVSATGVTGKVGHQGRGTSIMRSVSARLGYALNISGSGGIATLSLKGLRSHG